VAKLNGTLSGGETKIATYLSSNQSDATMEAQVLKGKYRIVYMTPERISYSSSFLRKLAQLHTSQTLKVCCVAIDECHCVSEWGHDFRPSYRSIGPSIRSLVELKDVPLIALTATAIEKVKQDVVSSLQMVNPCMVTKSVDRDNLILEVKSRSKGLRQLWLDLGLDKVKRIPSTIIYAASRSQVEEIANYLTQQLANHDMNGTNVVLPYHAGMSAAARTAAHTSFLISTTPIIVATIAFGMGIDKTDIRRIYHYGPPKTMEEYYQQIGRAGRDGVTSKCILYTNGNGDFDKYKSDFYQKGNDMEDSLTALRKFALNVEECRRKMILEYYGEETSSGWRCGTCDNCCNLKTFANDTERDFGSKENGGVARIVLSSLHVLSSPSKSVLEKVMNGGTVETYRYNYGVLGGRSAEEARDDLLQMKEVFMGEGKKKKRLLKECCKEILPGLISRGYVRQGTKKSNRNPSGFSSTWTTYDITPQGIKALNNINKPIMLPVPPAIREAERLEEEKRQELLSSLSNAGVDLAQVPKEELENGDGEVLAALKQWHSYLERLQKTGNNKRVDEMDDLRSRIEAWRSDMAVQFRMAPASVMEEHAVVKIAYTVASMGVGVRVNKDALFAAGVRSGGLDALVTTLVEWMDEKNKKNEVEGSGNNKTASGTGKVTRPMSFQTHTFKPSKSWEYAVYKPNKKTGLATWESSYNRFLAGEHAQTIAMTPANGRPIQVGTVVGHILDGLTHGREVDLKRLSSESTPPNEEEWDKLLMCESETGFDITGDPSTSGVDGGHFVMKDFLCPVMGNAFVMKDYTERSEEEKAEFSKWCGVLKWYMSLRRAGYIPSFDSHILV